MKAAGFYKKRVKVLNRGESKMGDRGQKEGQYEETGEYWARVIWYKGQVRQRERANDSVAKGTLYMRHHDDIDSDTHFIIGGKEFRQVETPIIEPETMEIQTVIAEVQ